MRTQIRNVKRLLAEESIPANQIAIEAGLTRAAVTKLRNGEQALEDAKLSTVMALSEVAEAMFKARRLNNYESEAFVYAEADYAKATKKVYSDAEHLFTEKVAVTVLHMGGGHFDVVAEVSTPAKHDYVGYKSLTLSQVLVLNFDEFAEKNNLPGDLVTDTFKEAWRYYENADIKKAAANADKNKKFMLAMRAQDYKPFSLDELKK